MDFEKQILAYLKLIINKDYKPKSLKVRYDNKNAFITMNNPKEANDFINKLQEYQKEHDINIFFNIYKSKVERISNNYNYKNFNNFDGQQMQISSGSGGKYKSFNNFAPMAQPTSGINYLK
jgi:hypothetical protein